MSTELPPGIPEIRNLNEYPDDWEFFACVVDGEVAFLMYGNKYRMPHWVAAWSSDPKIVLIPEAEKQTVKAGWTWDGTNFTAPQ